MGKKNFLLGKGERLTEDVRITSGGSEKVSPLYVFRGKEKTSADVR